MAELTKIDEILELVYNVTLGLDYDQPTSLERDLDLLADQLMAAKFSKKGFKPNSSDGYLTEVLQAMNDELLADAIDASGEIDEIIGRIHYGNLGAGDASELRNQVESLVSELEKYFDALKKKES